MIRRPLVLSLKRLAISVASLTLGLSLVTAAPAMAQLDTGTTLTSITIADSTQNETRLVLTFSQTLPSFSISSNDSPRAVILLSAVGRAPGANSPNFANGPVRELTFEQRGGALALRLMGGSALHVEATPFGAQSLLVVARGPEVRRAAAAAPLVGAPLSGLPAYQDPRGDEEQFAVVPLKYADVSEIVGLLSNGPPQKPNDSFIPQEPAFGSSGMGNGAANNYQQTLALQNQEAAPYGAQVDDTIGIDRRLNAIILHGPAERIRRLKARIAELDVPVTSVLLETVFVELTESGARNVGLDFKNSAGKFGVVTYNSGAFAPGATGLSNAGQTSAALQAAIYAQVQQGQGRILSRPRIAAQSGSSAKIITGDALPILTSIALSGVNAVSQQVQYVNVGVTLQIAPRVSEDGMVTSHIFCEVSSVTGYSQGYPTISQREASTTASVQDGQYFVIGGLTQENRLSTKEQLPVLGDIPGLGELFKLHLGSSAKTQLYIVVTPHITRGGDAATARAIAEK